MTQIVKFETDYGDVFVECDEGLDSNGSVHTGAKGHEPLSRTEDTPRFDKALSTLKGVAGSFATTLGELPMKPSEVEAIVNLKLSGGASFVIANAKSEVGLSVKLKWVVKEEA